ncbi:proteoglycan 4-like [Panonychus citri]|uniref:proteoglycan 4-like n=1 Tax=Panonychus citri TaxID=50023 RepID=UPI0023078AE8|nr:proteoglycan 4-like [Panonychus citri]
MDSWDPFRRPNSGIGDPVYSTPNSPKSLSSLPSPLRLPSPSSKSVTFAVPVANQTVPSKPIAPENLSDLINSDCFDWDNIAAAAQTVASPATPLTPTNCLSSLSLPSNPTVISSRLFELIRQEEEVSTRRNQLETELASVRSREIELSQQRSRLIKQLNSILSPQSNASPKSLTAPSVNSPSSIRPGETTIIESIPDSEPIQPRSDLNASTSTLIKKKIGPASKTGVKQISPGQLPPLGPSPNSSKKSRKDGDDSPKKPVTTGVKQSRPQPMRARKRNKPNESDSATESQLNISSQDQIGKDKQSPQSTQPPQPSKQPPQPQPPPQTQPQPSKQPPQPSKQTPQSTQPPPPPQKLPQPQPSPQKTHPPKPQSSTIKENTGITIKEEQHLESLLATLESSKPPNPFAKENMKVIVKQEKLDTQTKTSQTPQPQSSSPNKEEAKTKIKEEKVEAKMKKEPNNN